MRRCLIIKDISACHDFMNWFKHIDYTYDRMQEEKFRYRQITNTITGIYECRFFYAYEFGK